MEQARNGARAADLAEHLEVSEAKIHRWIAQDKIDQGERPGSTTADNAELRDARRRIKELETELAARKRASELFAKDRVVRPKELFPIVAQLAGEGHSSKVFAGCCRSLLRDTLLGGTNQLWMTDITEHPTAEGRVFCLGLDADRITQPKEVVHQLELSLAMVDWIEGFYNQRRRHSLLGNISPVEFERRQRHLTAA